MAETRHVTAGEIEVLGRERVLDCIRAQADQLEVGSTMVVSVPINGEQPFDIQVTFPESYDKRAIRMYKMGYAQAKREMRVEQAVQGAIGG